jgi:spermidine synthase
MQLWFSELQTPHMKISCRVKEVLHREKSPYQEIAVLDTYQFGRMLTLDDVIQTSERDEFVYHEMLVHLPLLTHRDPRRVLVIGGGDGGSVREVLKHPSVEQVVLAEIDERVVEVARCFLPTISCALHDPRVRLQIGDGIRHVQENPNTYDVILVDSTDPVGPAVGLFSADFYRSVHAALRPGGVFAAQTESPFFNQDLIKRVYQDVSAIFTAAGLYLAVVPTYPGGMWSFTIGAKDGALHGWSRERAAGLPTRYYSPELHEEAFTLPGFVKELLEKE